MLLQKAASTVKPPCISNLASKFAYKPWYHQEVRMTTQAPQIPEHSFSDHPGGMEDLKHRLDQEN